MCSRYLENLHSLGMLCPNLLQMDTLLLCLGLEYIPIYCVSRGIYVYDKNFEENNDEVQTR